jgi:hypothetical protein
VHFENVLKIDKDNFPPNDWVGDYTRLVITVCKWFGLRVISIKKCESRRKGLHFYIEIFPVVSAQTANRIQWLLGDDCQRVAFNQARIESNLDRWNKLFEKAGTRLHRVYTGSNERCPD